MPKKLCYLVDIIENNEACVVLKVKDNKELDLIKLGCFDGDERLIRLTKGIDHTCTIFYKGNREPFSWYWGRSGYTLVSDNDRKMGKLIEDSITEDFDIYIGENVSKVRETLYIKSLADTENIKHSIEIVQKKEDSSSVVVYKDDEFYKEFANSIAAEKHFRDLNYNVEYKDMHILETGCMVEEYNIQRNKELLNCQENQNNDYLNSNDGVEI